MSRDFRENLVTAASTILETLKIIDSHGVPIGLVHDDGRLLGTVTDGDIRRGILAGVTLDASVTKVMNTAPITAPAGISDADALKLMRKRAILYVPVVDTLSRIVGLKVLKDLQPSASVENPVMLMAGGLGTRLRPYTEDRPKPMLEVGGKPILQTIIEQFVDQGFSRIFISVNYRKEMIEDHFGDGSKWGARISYVHEKERMGTAGALALLPERLERPIIVMNGDLLTKMNFSHLVKFHDDRKSPATMCVRLYKFTVPYGVVDTDGDYLAKIDEKPVMSFPVNAGIYVVGPEAFDAIAGLPRFAAGNPFDMTDLFKTLMDNPHLRPTVFPLREYWIDIGQPDDLTQARREFTSLFTDE